jgi:hypothetical protein
MMAYFTEVCVGIDFRTAMWAGGGADGLSALCTEHSFGLVYGSTVGTLFPCCLLLCLLHHLLLWYKLLRTRGTLQHFLRSGRTVCLFHI